MLSHKELYARGCVASLIEILFLVPVVASTRHPDDWDDSTVRLLVLRTLLRCRRTFVLWCLEFMDVDINELTAELDELLSPKDTEDGPDNADAQESQIEQQIEPMLRTLLVHAEEESQELWVDYVGPEHLLLALIAKADAPLGSLLTRYHVDHAKLTSTIRQGLQKPAMALVDDGREYRQPTGPVGASWDTPAVGVPRQFGMGILMLIMTLYAFLFAAMQSLDAPPEVFIVVAVLVSGVGLGQMLLFGGKYPRAASIWIGGCLFPVEMVAIMIYMSWADAGNRGEAVVLLVFSVPLGAGFGYLMGGLTAGAFLAIDMYQKRREDR